MNMSDPFKIDEKTCISFSGGRTSAYMLWRVLQSNGGGLPDDAIVCFANTGKEEEATLQFVHDCETKWGIEIHWLEYITEEPKFKRVNFETANREGKPFEDLIRKRNYLPNPVTRFCTAELKIRTINKYLKSIGWKDHNENTDWVGIRADEMRRAAKMDRSRTPLVAAGITVGHVNEFWDAQSFNLMLPTFNGRTLAGNCDLCFLKPASQVASLIAEKPERGIWWARMEALALASKPSGAVFRSDRPKYEEMIRISKEQIDMFDHNEEGISCFCGD
jgi:3'-phosphoadenosine 5'-phosphosulfate sulfotransferase (PAPS reductase)/FAD synthetase